MIYFLINNNYHRLDFENHLSHLDENNVTLIEIPHTLDERRYTKLSGIFRYRKPPQSGLMAQVMSFLSLVRKIGADINPTSGDTLFFYTEYEILNQYVAGRFMQAGSRVYLIEDGGLGTYVPFRMSGCESLTLKESTKQFVYRLLPGISRIRLHKLNGFIFPWMPDSCITGVCLYRPVSISRIIPTHILKRPFQPQVNCTSGRVVFLNEPIYSIYQGEEEYIDGLIKIVDGLCNGFNEVLFKFHPRETDEWRTRIKQQITFHFPRVNFIKVDTAIEEVVDHYHPSVVASYFCSALLSLCDRGIQPLFLYHLIPDIQRQPIFRETTSVLTDLGYHFVENFSEANSNFRSGLLNTANYQNSITLAELIGQNRA
ncbi:polysialyltransferase family glycosyltransferase [Rhodoferax ferrireducens]|uniref:polysialyltransferase family glycosyltransferase n=1 Tax=Rhodoferax ferrireducens TaxID=192843 RepID=UPI00298D9B4C|nr:polysialyltransferase family glycosyltransferase [Rhodoferax ferrireducens]WPC68118.1 polysialyltransferase family glycosyltransferase [Rhodoferax ferrireducens]